MTKPITSADLLEIMRLYDKHLGRCFGSSYLDDDFREMGLDSEINVLFEELVEEGHTSRREGSKYDEHAKLRFGLDDKGNLEIEVNLNFDPKERTGPRYEEAQQDRDTFLKQAADYLKQRQ